jgi:hypothetical protein
MYLLTQIVSPNPSSEHVKTQRIIILTGSVMWWVSLSAGRREMADML